MIRNIIWGMMFLLSTGKVFGQETDNKTIRKMRPGYVKLGVGVCASSFRDFATSPLFYSGTSGYVAVGYLKKDTDREVEFGTTYAIGRNSNVVATNYAVSQIQSLSGYYSRLYKIPNWSDSNWNIKAGAMVNVTGNYRYNSSLLNNGEGFELVGNVMGSMQVIRNVSRTKAKTKKILFIKYSVKPREKELGFRLNAGLINGSFRNGYAYIGQSSIINDSKVFDGYEFALFSGFRMSSALDYTFQLSNGNAMRFSYGWDAYSTGGDLDTYEMVSHVLKFTLLFKTN